MPPKLSFTPTYSSNIEVYGELDSAGLTPRTPFSRQTASAEEGRSRRAGTAIPVNGPIAEDEDDENLDEVDLLQTQSHPLLASSASDSFPASRHANGTGGPMGKRRRWQRLKDRLVRERAPIGLIIGTGLAFLLLFMAVISIKRPDTLRDYIGVNSTAIAFESLDEESQLRFNSSNIIDYTQAGYTSYPLATHEYVKECWNVTNYFRTKGWVDYWDQHAGGDPDVLHKKPASSPKTCSSSITYLLDGTVGLMADLAHLAQVAGFAREQNRTLLIFDEYWNRGKWTDHFLPFSETQPGPEPGCSPPPPEELVACPRTARHWVISARTAYFHMGDSFNEAFDDPYKYNIERKKPVFDRAAESFRETILPNEFNENLIKDAREEIKALISQRSDQTNPGYIATHIRRGDRQAMSWRYTSMPNSQIPISEYADAALKAYSHFRNLSSLDTSPPLIYLATDSPSAASEFTNLITNNDSYAQTRGNETARPIVYELRSSPDLGLRNLSPATEYVQKEWDKRDVEDRIRETRGMIVDWALLSGAWGPRKQDDVVEPQESVKFVKPTATICGLPSNICKLVPLGLGWNMSFAIVKVDRGPDRRWVEIDNRGDIAPIWQAFEIFKAT